MWDNSLVSLIVLLVITRPLRNEIDELFTNFELLNVNFSFTWRFNARSYYSNAPLIWTCLNYDRNITSKPTNQVRYSPLIFQQKFPK